MTDDPARAFGEELRCRSADDRLQAERLMALEVEGLTATPMQVHPVEVPKLGLLLNGCSACRRSGPTRAFLGFFDDIEQPNPSSNALDRMAKLFQSVERHYGRQVKEDGGRATAGWQFCRA